MDFWPKLCVRYDASKLRNTAGCRRMVGMKHQAVGSAHQWGRIRLACILASLFVLGNAQSWAEQPRPAQEPGPPPAVRIPVGPLGYQAPSSFYLTSRLSSASLDFIDNEHVLFTFHISGLMKRLANDPPDDEDQTIRAVVLDLRTGKIDAQTEWRMHDRARYLWALDDGHFLVRQRDTLWLTDSTLKLKPYLNLANNLVAVEFSPDRKLLMLESREQPPETEATPALQPDGALQLGSKSTRLYMLRPDTRQVIATSVVPHEVELPLLSDGYVNVLPGKKANTWLVSYTPFKGEPKPVVEVDSACQPAAETLSADAALVEGCWGSGGDHKVETVTLNGGRMLWQQTWSNKYIWPTFTFSGDGKRFAYGSIQLSHSISTLDPVDETDIVNQMVGVFDTVTGKLQLVKTATPILSAGQNYALSDDGRRFAILREGAIEIYDLPPAETTPLPAPKAARK